MVAPGFDENLDVLTEHPLTKNRAWKKGKRGVANFGALPPQHVTRPYVQGSAGFESLQCFFDDF